MSLHESKHTPSWLYAGRSELCALACFFFVFLAGMYMFDARMETFFAASLVPAFESLILGASVIGFLVRPLLYYRHPKQRHNVSILIGTLTTAALILMLIAERAWVVIVGGLVAFASLGYVGSAAHAFVARRYAGSPYTARAVAAAYAASVVLQFACHMLVPIEIVKQGLVVVLAIVSVSILHAVAQSPAEEGLAWDGSSIAGDAPTQESKTTVARLNVATFCLTGIFAALNAALTASHASGSIGLGDWSRLILAASALVAGLLFDTHRRRYMNIIMTSVAMLSTISLFVLICGGNPLLGALVFYLGSGFFVVFFTTSYMEIAPNMRMRELWPSAGRIVNNIGSLLVSSPAVALVTKGDVLGAVSAAIVLFIGIATSLLTRLGDDESGLLRGSVSDGVSGADADNASASAASFEVASVSVEHELSFEERVERFAAAYGFTPREREVLQAIASSDESAQAIADSLYLSRSTLYRHIGSMNKKTDTSSRAALIKAFWTWTDVS